MPVIHSTGWKTITLKIHGSEETLELPVMIACKVWQLKCQLAEHLEMDHPSEIQLFSKNGCSWKQQRNGDEVQTKLVVKGIKTFGKRVQEYPLPYGIIGGGHFGLRQAMHYERRGLNYCLFERKKRSGGNAWVTIANHQSKLQSEGPQYQLNYDLSEMENGMLLDYGYWPSRQLIMRHFDVTLKRYGCWPHCRWSTEVTDCISVPEPPGKGFDYKAYDLVLKKTDGSEQDDVFRVSCLTFYPGCLCVPHRKTWPGEDVFGGNIGYGFSNEFNYAKARGENAIIIGMGAFAAENVRTCFEYGVKKSYVVARHFNLLLPRCISWYINQSQAPPPAAFILDAFKPMYSLLGWDPWNFFSITANADRTMASIKQYTRWGIGDSTFLACYYEKCEIVEGEIKRFKEHSAVLLSGRILRDIKHIVKVIGFDGDFGVDRVLHAKKYQGFWPEGDWRRWCMSDQSAIDASRFGGTALSPFGCSFSNLSLFFMQNPKVASALANSSELPVGTADVEKGSPGYHYEPRIGTAAILKYSSYHEDITQFENINGQFKKRSLWYMAPPEKFVEECRADWFSYCEMFKREGDNRPFPPYPYDVDFLNNLQRLEIEFGTKEFLRNQEREIKKATEQLQQEGLSLQRDQQPGGSKAVVNSNLPVLVPNGSLSFEPMKAVLRARQRSTSRSPSPDEARTFQYDGQQVKDWLKENTRPAEYAGAKSIGS